MADIRQTQVSNYPAYYGAGLLNYINEAASKPFGYENDPVRALTNLLGVPAIVKTLENTAYGMPNIRGTGIATQLRPEAKETVGALLPATPGAARLAARGAVAGGKYIAPKVGGLLDDYATKTGLQMYVYRPTSPSNPDPSAVAAPSQQALNEAQKNATKMLGLPPDNTPMDRAKALNFIAPGYHGTVENVTSFNPAFRGSATGAPSAKKAFFAASKPQVSTGYSLLGEGREATAIQRELAAAEKARDWNKVQKLTEQYENVVLGNRNIANKISDQRFEAEKDFGNVLDKYGVVQDYYLNKPALGDATTESAMMSRLAVRDQAYQQALSKLPNKINQQKLWADFEKANGGSVLWNTLDEYEAIANKISSKNKKLGDLYRATHDGRWETMPEFQKDPKALAELNKAYNQLRSLDTQYYNLDVPSGANVMPLLINTQGFKVKDFKGSHYRDETYNDLIKEAAASKMPGVLMKNTFDPGQKAYNEITDVFAVIDPSRIRSRFAAFDPARVNESDLLAAGVPLGLLAGTNVEMPKKQEKKSMTPKR